MLPQWTGRFRFARLPRALAILLVCALAAGPLTGLAPRAAAQGDQVVLQLAVPEFYRDAFSAQLLSDFEAANPGVKVQIKDANLAIPDVINGLDKHFEEIGKYAQSADVLFVTSTTISNEATLAGYFLDLAPLTQVDTTLNSDDFYPAIWNSFQWNRGIWALPTGTDALLLTYDPAAFDRAGVAYPNDSWTMDDLAAAARALVIKDDTGKITQQAINLPSATYDALVLRALVAEGLFDSAVVPNSPMLARDDVAEILGKYYELEKEGLIGRGVENAPIAVEQGFRLLVQIDPEKKRVGTLLPGGKAGITPQGFAVSAGTQYPQQAYELAKFLTNRAEVSNRFTSSPARRSLAGADSGTGFQLNIPQEVQDLLARAIENGLPVAELRFTNYLVPAISQMRASDLDAKSALQQVETTALDDFNKAIAKKDDNTLAVVPPAPITELAAGKISLKFALGTFVSPLPNQDKWDTAIADFVASDPTVGRIEFEAGFRALQSIDQAAKDFDCFYLPYNAVPSADLSKLLNLDPLMASDTAFDKNDVVGNVMAQLTRDNKVWGYPIVIEPAILRYDSEQFRRAGATEPGAEWTISAFNDAVRALKPNPTDDPPFVPSATGGTHLLVLIAAYGGLPLDYRQDPPVIQFTDPTVAEAIRQVLNLAKDGYIKYTELGTLNFGFGGRAESGTIVNQTLNAFVFARPTDTTTEDAYKPTTYPRGTTFTAASYTIGTAHISATSQNPEACYRWISRIAGDPELFSAMPARRSSIANLSATQAPEVLSLYNTVDAILQDPNTISLPSLFDGGNAPTSFLFQYWLYQAFDAYVLKDKDLDVALAEAEGYAKAFQECAVNLPPLDNSSQESAREYIKAFGDCATKVDARLKPLFALIR
jgi:ABC-type glycerol-3-phosphate transport system substrate-binding protein